MLNKLKNKARSLAVAARTKVETLRAFAKNEVADTAGEAYVDTGVKILIAVVIGALLLTLLYALFNTTIFPTLREKVEGLFEYSGT